MKQLVPSAAHAIEGTLQKLGPFAAFIVMSNGEKFLDTVEKLVSDSQGEVYVALRDSPKQLRVNAIESYLLTYPVKS